MDPAFIPPTIGLFSVIGAYIFQTYRLSRHLEKKNGEGLEALWMPIMALPILGVIVLPIAASEGDMDWLLTGNNSAVATIIMFGLTVCVLIPCLASKRGPQYYEYKFKKKELKLRAKRYGCIRRAAALAAFAAAIAAAAFGTVRLLRYLFKGDTAKVQQ